MHSHCAFFAPDGTYQIRLLVRSVRSKNSTMAVHFIINQIAAGQRLAGVLGQCGSLAHLDLSGNSIRDEGVGRLAGVLGQ